MSTRRDRRSASAAFGRSWTARHRRPSPNRAASRARRLSDEPRVSAIGLVLDRLSDPMSRQLPAFEAQAGRWEELRWSLERVRARFGDGRLWRAEHIRPNASLAEQRSRLVDIGP